MRARYLFMLMPLLLAGLVQASDDLRFINPSFVVDSRATKSIAKDFDWRGRVLSIELPFDTRESEVESGEVCRGRSYLSGWLASRVPGRVQCCLRFKAPHGLPTFHFQVQRQVSELRLDREATESLSLYLRPINKSQSVDPLLRIDCTQAVGGVGAHDFLALHSYSDVAYYYAQLKLWLNPWFGSDRADTRAYRERLSEARLDLVKKRSLAHPSDMERLRVRDVEGLLQQDFGGEFGTPLSPARVRFFEDVWPEFLLIEAKALALKKGDFSPKSLISLYE